MVIFIEVFWADESLVLFPSTKKVEKKLNIWFVHLQVIFDPVTNIRKTDLRICFVVDSWNLNLKSKRVHLPRSCQKSLSIDPLEEKWRTEEAELLFCHTESRRSHREVKRQKEAAIRLKGVKENAWMLKLGEVC